MKEGAKNIHEQPEEQENQKFSLTFPLIYLIADCAEMAPKS